MDALVPSCDAYSSPIQIARVSRYLEPRHAVKWLTDALGEARVHPARTLIGMSVGWLVLVGYGTGNFVPFYKCASVVSTIGFLLAGFATTRVRGSAAFRAWPAQAGAGFALDQCA